MSGVDHPEDWGPTLSVGFGVDVAQWPHGALDLSLIESAWRWNGALRGDFALEFGYSYY